MGLDIRAYRGLKKVENPLLDEDEYPENDNEWTPGVGMEFSEEYFPGRGEGLESNAVYAWEDTFYFSAGSYSGYNWWRDKLEDFSDGDSFIELINFADNEGVIGPIVSKKLYNDFIKNHYRAIIYSETLEDGDYWLKKYKEWEKAFEMASDNGAVDFY